jgi:hypothetical protein
MLTSVQACLRVEAAGHGRAPAANIRSRGNLRANTPVCTTVHYMSELRTHADPMLLCAAHAHEQAIRRALHLHLSICPRLACARSLKIPYQALSRLATWRCRVGYGLIEAYKFWSAQGDHDSRQS